MYGIDNYTNPPFSILIYILLFFGFKQIGAIFLKKLNLINIIENVSELKFQQPLIGIYLVIFFLYPLTYLFEIKFNLFVYFSFFISVLGLINIIKLKKFISFNKKSIKTKINLEEFFYYLIIGGLLLVSISPVTSADSLDYHLSIPISYFNNNHYPNVPYHFHSKLIGAGDIVTFIGLSLKAESLTSLTQFCGLLSIVGILKKFLFSKKNNSGNYLISFFISSPILIFLLSSAKPQFIAVAASSLSFTLIFFNNVIINNYQKLIKVIFILTILLISSQVKYSFYLSSFILGIFLLKEIFYFDKKNLFYFIIFISLIIVYFILPSILWKIEFYKQSFFEALVLPLPLNLPGYDFFLHYLSHKTISSLIFLFIPENASQLAHALGIGPIIIILIYLLHIKKFNKFKIPLFLIFLLISISYIFGQITARFFIEPYAWLSILICYNYKTLKIKYENYFRYLSIMQSCVILMMISFAVYTLFPGAMNKNMRTQVMNNTAFGYQLFNWSNKVLPEDARLISTHRSVALSNFPTLSIDFANYTTPKTKDINYYMELIKLEKPNYILFYGKNFNSINIKINAYDFSRCLNDLVYESEPLKFSATRNPFSPDFNEMVIGYIYEFDYKKLPNCLIKYE